MPVRLGRIQGLRCRSINRILLTLYAVPTNENVFKLFVGGIPYSMTSDQVQELFSNAGQRAFPDKPELKVSSVYLPVDRMNNNRPRGFGFVEYENEEDAKTAMSLFDDYEVDGRKLKVNEARPKDDRE